MKWRNITNLAQTCSSDPPDAMCSPDLEKATAVVGPWNIKTKFI